MSDIEKIKNSISKPVPFSFKDSEGNEQTINLKPFTVAQQARALTLSSKLQVFQQFDGSDTSDKMKNMDEETYKKMENAMQETFDLLVSVVERSIDDIERETAEEFVNTHFESLMTFMDQLSPQADEKRKADLIEERKKQQGKK